MEAHAAVRAVRSSRGYAAFVVLSGVAAAVLLGFDRHSEAGWFALFMFFVLLGVVPAVMIHEGGHALAAALVGFRVFKIQIGRGRSLWQRRVAGIELSLHEAPQSGWIFAAPPTARFVRGRAAVFVLGGVALNLAVAAAFFLAWKRGLTSHVARLPLLLLFALFWCNLFGLLNLLPLQARNPLGRISGTDGRILLRVLF